MRLDHKSLQNKKNDIIKQIWLYVVYIRLDIRDIEPILGQCCPAVYDVGPT